MKNTKSMLLTFALGFLSVQLKAQESPCPCITDYENCKPYLIEKQSYSTNNTEGLNSVNIESNKPAAKTSKVSEKNKISLKKADAVLKKKKNTTSKKTAKIN